MRQAKHGFCPYKNTCGCWNGNRKRRLSLECFSWMQNVKVIQKCNHSAISNYLLETGQRLGKSNIPLWRDHHHSQVYSNSCPLQHSSIKYGKVTKYLVLTYNRFYIILLKDQLCFGFVYILWLEVDYIVFGLFILSLYQLASLRIVEKDTTLMEKIEFLSGEYNCAYLVKKSN